MKHDAHYWAWVYHTCPYARLPYIKQACHFCNNLTRCHY